MPNRLWSRFRRSTSDERASVRSCCLPLSKSRRRKRDGRTDDRAGNFLAPSKDSVKAFEYLQAASAAENTSEAFGSFEKRVEHCRNVRSVSELFPQNRQEAFQDCREFSKHTTSCQKFQDDFGDPRNSGTLSKAFRYFQGASHTCALFGNPL